MFWSAGLAPLRLVTYAEPNCHRVEKRSIVMHANVTVEAGNEGISSMSKERRLHAIPKGMSGCQWYPGMSVLSYKVVHWDGKTGSGTTLVVP